MKKKLFIGSSSEKLDLANAAKSLLEKDFDVTIWDESIWDKAVFKINQNYLNDLIKASLKFDFGILLGTPDDKVEYRGQEVMQPRDNVLFELGLFIGRLGLNNCAFIIDKKIRNLSDIQGISLTRFDSSAPASFITAVNQVKDFFLSNKGIDINFFPSVTLAAVYHENFVVPTCRHILQNCGFDHRGASHKKCKIKIVIPKSINTDVNLQFEMLKGKLSLEKGEFQYAGRPRFVSVDTKMSNGVLEFIDFPTVITGINHAIANLLPADYNQRTTDYDLILERELNRFVATLTHFIKRDGFGDMVDLIDETSLT